MTVAAKNSGRARIASRNVSGPSNGTPFGSVPVESMETPPSSSRQRPMASKFSSANPSGSIVRWQLAHNGLARWAAKISRPESFCPGGGFSGKGGTLGNGGCGGVPRMFVRIHLPRTTGEVLLAYEVTARILPWLSSPPRSLPSGKSTRRKWLP